VSISLTNLCDLQCPYCFAPKNSAALNIERVTGWLDELDANGCLGVGFGGGEPTLYTHLADLCRYATEKTGLATTLTTHAHRLDDALAADLGGNVHFVRVSMDGVEATYEILRGRSFAALRKQLELVGAIASFGLNYVVNARTFPDLDAAISFAAEVGAVEVLLLPERSTEGGGGIDDRTLAEFRSWVNQYCGKVPLTVSEDGAEGLPTCNPLAGETGLRAYAHISATGILMRSSFDTSGVAIADAGLIPTLSMLRNHHEEA
jgi:MoaA/NifB/PqqE/SkfB family radical SAM enzyme